MARIFSKVLLKLSDEPNLLPSLTLDATWRSPARVNNHMCFDQLVVIKALPFTFFTEFICKTV